MSSAVGEMRTPSRDDDRYIVVSADSHVGPLVEEFRRYCPSRFRDEFELQVEATRAARAETLAQRISRGWIT